MSRLFVLFGLLAFGAGPLAAQEPMKGPAGPAPQFLTVTKVDLERGEITFERLTTVNVVVQVKETIERNGQVREVVRDVTKLEQRKTPFSYKLKDVAPQTVGGKKLSPEEAAQRARPGTVVLVSPGGKAIDPAYARILNPEALVLVPRENLNDPVFGLSAQPPAPPLAAPAPPPPPPPK